VPPAIETGRSRLVAAIRPSALQVCRFGLECPPESPRGRDHSVHEEVLQLVRRTERGTEPAIEIRKVARALRRKENFPREDPVLQRVLA